MKKFDKSYPLLKDMVDDEYYPKKCVDKVKKVIQELIAFLEAGHTKVAEVQEKLDDMTRKINDLAEDFDENNSEIETVARDSIAVSVGHILKHFEIDIDIETAIREREW
jgi:uncharacterized protein YoxC